MYYIVNPARASGLYAASLSPNGLKFCMVEGEQVGPADQGFCQTLPNFDCAKKNAMEVGNIFKIFQLFH